MSHWAIGGRDSHFRTLKSFFLLTYLLTYSVTVGNALSVGMERLQAELECERVWRSGKHPTAFQSSLDTRHSPLQQVRLLKANALLSAASASGI